MSSLPRKASSSKQQQTIEEEALDLSLLTDDDAFESESAWLNTLIQSSPHDSLAALDATLSKINSQLQVATHDTSALVDRSIDDISRSVPRLTFDLQLMRENALLLRFTLDGIRKRAAAGSNPDSPVTKVMERLRVLDLVKARMEAARDVLREAESWSTLESEVTALVGESAFAKAAERLEEAARSMVVFQNTTEYEARRALMISLQNQLEASLSSSLVKAINERDVKACKAFYMIFGQIQREQEFTAYYFGSRRAGLIKDWSAAILTDSPEDSQTNSSGANSLPAAPISANATPTLANIATFENSSITHATNASSYPTTLVNFLVKFYTDLHSLLVEESTYVPAIFPSPAPTLSSFIQTTLEGLSPSLPHRISSLSTYLGPIFLPELIQAYRATSDFALTVERIMSKLSYSTPPSFTTPPPPTPSSAAAVKMDRRNSRRQLSASKRFGSRSLSFGGGSASGSALMGLVNPDGTDASGDMLRAWEIAIFEPFLDWQTEYPRLEKTYLVDQIEKEIRGRNLMKYLVRGAGNPTGGIAEVVGSERVLWELVQMVVGLVEDAIGRLMALTHGYAAVGLIEVVEGQLVQFFEKRRTELRSVRSDTASGRTEVDAHAGNGINDLRRASIMSGLGGDEDEAEEALEGLEYSSEDWGAFQKGLRLLDTCRLIEGRIAAFEVKLKARLTVLAGAVRDARNEQGGYTAPGTTRGAITILRQSSLNSAALANLLTPLEKPVEGQSQQSQPSQLPTPSSQTQPSPHHHLHHVASPSLPQNGSGFPFHVNSPLPPVPSSSSTSTSSSLLPQTRSAATDFTKATQLFLHETILAPLLSHLNDYAFLPVWTTPVDERPGGKGAFELAIPTFSLSPTETISRVGEGLFNLPRLFEVYADDDALAFSIETLPFVDVEALREMMGYRGGAFSNASGAGGESDKTPPMTPRSGAHRMTSFTESIDLTLSNGVPPQTPTLGRRSTTSTLPGASSTPALPPTPLPLPAETVIATWLSSLTLAVLSHITTLVLPSVHRLTPHGAKQLASDLGYIANVARALDVESPEELEAWREAVEWEKEEDRLEAAAATEVGEKEKEIRDRVARIRGWKK